MNVQRISQSSSIDLNPLTADQICVTGTTQSTDQFTGSIKTAGGLGVEKNLNVGGTGGFVGAVTVTNATDSTSNSTGSIITAGGVGIAKNVYMTGHATIFKTDASLTLQTTSEGTSDYSVLYFNNHFASWGASKTGIFTEGEANFARGRISICCSPVADGSTYVSETDKMLSCSGVNQDVTIHKPLICNDLIFPQQAAGDPTGVTGGMYYNTTANTMKYYDGSVWKTITAV